MNILLLLLAMVQDHTSLAIETKDNSGDGKGARIVSSYNIYLGLNSTFLSSHIFNSKIFVSPPQQLQKWENVGFVSQICDQMMMMTMVMMMSSLLIKL